MPLARKPTLVTFAALFVLLQLIVACVGFRSLLRQRSVDFRTYYAAGKIVRAGDGAHLYDYETQRIAQNQTKISDVYAMRLMGPPFTALPFVPLSSLSFLQAYFFFLILNLLFVGIAIHLISPSLPALSAHSALVPTLLFLGFLPVEIALGQGQLSIILLALYCGAYRALKQGHPVWAGLLISIALLKFQIALPVALLFLLWRQWRFVSGFSLGIAMLAVLSFATLRITHPASLFHFFISIPQTWTAVASQLKYGTRADRMPNLYGFAYALSQGHHWGLVLTVACSVLLLIWAVRKSPSLPLAVLVSVLVSYHLYLHDLSVLLLPIALICNDQFLVGRTSNLQRVSVAKLRLDAGLFAMVLLLLGPITLILMGADRIYLLVVPLAVLTIAIGGALPESEAERDTILSSRLPAERIPAARSN